MVAHKDWTEDQIATMTLHWNSGILSAKDIGFLIGKTKNAVCGMRKRMGLSARHALSINSTYWTDSEIDVLRKAKADGLSTAKIAALLPERTIEAVETKCAVMQLYLNRAARRPSTVKQTLPPPVVALPKAPVQIPVTEKRIHVLPSNTRSCQFPMWGHNERAGWPQRFCGHETDGSVYCEEHHKICYRKGEEAA